MQFAILGAGALGTILGAHLARAGHQVTLLARGERVAELERDGLVLSGLAELRARCEVLSDPGALRRTQTLVVATKAIGSVAALSALSHLELDCAFSLQNGVQKNALLGDVFGADRVLGCMADFSGELLASGVVKFTRNVCLHLGELRGGESERVAALAGLIEASGVHAVATGDIREREWSKFVGWIAQLPLAVLTRRLTWEFLLDPDAAAVIVRLARETKALADAEGIAIHDAPPLPVASIAGASDAAAVGLVRRAGARYRNTAPEHRMSTQQDALRGKPLEIEETIGYALERAETLGVPMPTLDTAYRLLRAAHPQRG